MNVLNQETRVSPLRFLWPEQGFTNYKRGGGTRQPGGQQEGLGWVVWRFIRRQAVLLAD
jgi:hypothetical protein